MPEPGELLIHLSNFSQRFLPWLKVEPNKNKGKNITVRASSMDSPNNFLTLNLKGIQKNKALMHS